MFDEWGDIYCKLDCEAGKIMSLLDDSFEDIFKILSSQIILKKPDYVIPRMLLRDLR
jgi:hypothetical protein